jgi:hypothetical protein
MNKEVIELSKEELSKAFNLEIEKILDVEYLQEKNSNYGRGIRLTYTNDKVEYENFVTKPEWIEVEIRKLPEHVFLGVPKSEFLEYVENVLLKIEKFEEIHIPAAISFLKIKFISGDIDIESNVLMIENQCKK